MNLLKDFPIQRKISLVILATCTLAVTIAGAAVLAIQWLVVQPYTVDAESPQTMTLLIGLIGLTLIFSILLALILSSRLQRVISDPIQKLADTAEEIAGHHDYSLRSNISGNDEIGVFSRAFNNMLDRIQETDHALRESEKRYRRLFHANPMPLLVYNTGSLAIMAVNDAACRLYDYTEHAMKTMTIKELKPDSEIQDLMDNIHKTTESISFFGPVHHKVKSGQVIDVETISHAITFDGQPARLVLIHDITEQERHRYELEKLNQDLMAASRQAGMAEITTGILHNIGNVMNSINVSATLLQERIKHNRIGNLSRIADLLLSHVEDIGPFMTSSPQGQALPNYLSSLADHLMETQTQLLKEADLLIHNVAHTKDIIAVQQNYAHSIGMVERMTVEQLIDDAWQIHADAFKRADIRVERNVVSIPPMLIDKYRGLQVLVNLFKNALEAMKAMPPDAEKTLKIESDYTDEDRQRVFIRITDSGVGIPRENVIKIFNHGFTTKADGHGFGLHSSALAAREMNGHLSVTSEGPEQGATFILELPLEEENAVHGHAVPTN